MASDIRLILSVKAYDKVSKRLWKKMLRMLNQYFQEEVEMETDHARWEDDGGPCRTGD